MLVAPRRLNGLHGQHSCERKDRKRYICALLSQYGPPYYLASGAGAGRAQLCDSRFHPQPPILSLCRSMDAISSLASFSLSPPALIAATAYLRVNASAGLLSRFCATRDPSEGIDTIAGGNAPGNRPLSGPTLPGSNPVDTPPLMPPAAQGHGTPVGSGDRAARFPGALPPATFLCPGGARGRARLVRPRLPPTVHSDSYHRLWQRRYVPFNVFTEKKLVARRYAYFAFLCGFSLRVRGEKHPARVWGNPRRNPLADGYLHATPLLPESIRWRGQLRFQTAPHPMA